MKTKMFGEVFGTEWEIFCQQMMKVRYNGINSNGVTYQEVPAKFGGDYGIEGFTTDGTFIQCYCPEEGEIKSSLYDHQRDKITTDINKLVKNITDINKLTGSITVREWHLLTPYYDNKMLLSHCRAKEKLVLQSIPDHVHDNFKIFLKTETDFIPEAEILLNNGQFKVELSTLPVVNDIDTLLTSTNDIIDRIKNKVSHIENVKSNPENLSRLVKSIFQQYEQGQREILKLQQHFPQLELRLRRLKQQIEARIESESLASTLPGGELLKNTRAEYRDVLEKEFDKSMEQSLIECLTNEAIADWLVRCPLAL